MLKNDLKIGLRILRRHAGYSIINIVGLSVGIACSLFMFLFVFDELSYDRFHENSNRIYRVAQNISIDDRVDSALATPQILADTLIKDFPQIRVATRVVKIGKSIVKHGNLSFKEPRVYAADAAFFDVFSFDLVKGDAKTALAKPNSIILTESTFNKYFGINEALGQNLKIGQYDFTVTAIARDVPRNSHFHFDFLTSTSSYPRSKSTRWFDGFCATYILLDRNFSPETIEAQFPSFVQKYLFAGKSGNEMFKHWEYFLQPLNDIHLHSQLKLGEFESNSHIAYVYIFSVIAVFILFIACINFVNLSTARANIRAKEVGIRKVVGSKRSQLIRQFLSESIILSLIAFAIGLALVHLFLPFFQILVGKKIELSFFSTWYQVPGLLLMALAVGIGSGLYPSFVLSSFRLSSVIKGSNKNSNTSRSTLLRRGLIVFQFATSIFLFIGTTVVFKQTDFFQSQQLGFDREHIIVVKNIDYLRQNVRIFKDKLLQHPDIQLVSGTTALPGGDLNFRFITPEGQQEGVVLEMLNCDHDYQEVLQLEIAQGRFFSAEFPSDINDIVINEEAASHLGWSKPLGKTFKSSGKDYHVIGVLKDFHHYSFHEKINKMGLFHSPLDGKDFVDLFAVRIQSTWMPTLLSFLKKNWESLSPPVAFEYSFLDEDYAALYHVEMRTKKVAAVFSILAILISCLGLFGLASFTAEKRRKEIGIRKVIGASIPQIMILLAKEYLKWIILANVIAWPAAYFAMNKWLENFAFRIDIAVGTFFLSALFAFVIAFTAVLYQTIKASVADPVDSLRYE